VTSDDEAVAAVERALNSGEARIHLFAALGADGKVDHSKTHIYDECPHCRAMLGRSLK
jgi:hypothetical protein